MLEPNIIQLGPRHIFVDNSHLVNVVFWDYLNEFKAFQDQLVVVIGGGPSCAQIRPNLLSDTPFICVNSSCRLFANVAKPNDLLYFSDNGWNENFPELLNNWPGIRVTSNRHAKARNGDKVNRIDLTPLTEFMQVMSDYVHASSGHIAASLAAHLGAKTIVLIGFECGIVNGRTHGHDDYAQLETNAYENRFLPGWVGLSGRFEELGIRVINSTPESKITSFEYLPFEEAIKL